MHPPQDKMKKPKLNIQHITLRSLRKDLIETGGKEGAFFEKFSHIGNDISDTYPCDLPRTKLIPGDY